MKLAVVAYGHPVLRKRAEEVSPKDEGIPQLVADLWDTMYDSNGVGIAAPQVNKGVRIFVVDTVQIVENFDEEDKREYPHEQPIKSVFINPEKLAEGGDEWAYNEGCLSIPKVREDVMRKATVTMRYLDENYNEHTQTFDGITARVILHEYDHLEGKLFIDYLAPLKKKMLQKKLTQISQGKVHTDYRMLFPK